MFRLKNDPLNSISSRIKSFAVGVIYVAAFIMVIFVLVVFMRQDDASGPSSSFDSSMQPVANTPMVYTSALVDKTPTSIPCPVWRGYNPHPDYAPNLVHNGGTNCVYTVPINRTSAYPKPIIVLPRGCTICPGWNIARLYVVKPGDTLWDLAIRWGYPASYWRYLALDNKIANVRTLQIGRVIADLP